MAAITFKELAMGSRIAFHMYGSVNGMRAVEGVLVSTAIGSFVPQTAGAYENHSNIYPLLPADMKKLYQNDYTKYEYLVIQLDDGSIVYIGKPWIVEATLTRIQSATTSVVLRNVPSTKLDLIYQLMEQNGFEVVSLVQTES